MDPQDESGSIDIPSVREVANSMGNTEDHGRSTRIERMLQSLYEIYEQPPTSISIKEGGTTCFGDKGTRRKGSAPGYPGS